MSLTTLKRLPRALRWLIAGIALALGVVAAAGIADWMERRSVERVARWNETTRVRLSDASSERKPLCGPVMPGNAWDDYIPACRNLGELPGNSLWWRVDGMLIPITTPAEVVERAGESLKLIHQGARRSEARYPADLPDQQAWRVHEVLGAEAEVRFSAGDLDGTIESWATALQFDLDYPGGGSGFSRTVLEVAYRLLQQPKLTPSQAGRIGVLAELAEAQLPRASSLLESSLASLMEHEIELARTERFGTTAEWLARWGSDLPPTHRSRVLHLQKLHQGVVALAMEVETGALGPSLARIEEFERAAGSAGVDDDSAWHSWWKDDERVVRQMRGELRLMKAAALVRQGKDEQVAGWPCDPCDLQPLSTGDAPERQTRVFTRPMDHLWHNDGGCCPGGISNSSMEITVPR